MMRNFISLWYAGIHMNVSCLIALQRLVARASLVALFTFILVSALTAQVRTGSLHGQVLDPSGAVIPNADISLKDASGHSVTATSDGIGAYAIRNLSPGKYSITVSEKGFRPALQDVEVVAGENKSLNFTMEVYVQEEHVDVQSDAARVSVNPDNNASSLVISGKDLDALSDDPDELQSELQALAGPSAGPNGGQIYIDGFTGGQLPPKSSIREIRINQNPFSAQYDRMGFGRIEILTKPGTDKVHGQFFYNDNHSIFDALNPFAASETDFSTKMFNGNVGGPLSKKASYFLNVERRDIQDAAVISPGAFTQAGVPVVALSTPRVRNNMSARFDYQMTNNNTLTARYQFTRDTQDNNGIGQLALPSQAYNQASTEHTIQISDTQVLSSKAINETRFEWEHNHTAQNALTLSPSISVLGEFTEGGNPIGISQATSDHFELQNYTSINIGTHFMRFGGRLRATAEDNNSTQNFNGTFTFGATVDPTTHQLLASPLQNFQGNQPTQLTIIGGNPAISDTFVDAGLYAEDDWKFRPNMTLSYGLRFETQNGIKDQGDWAPRVGFAWGLGGSKKNPSPKTVIRTGFGIFYDRFSQNLIMQAERLNGVNQQQFTLDSTNQANRDLLKALFLNFPNVPSVAGLPAGLNSTYTISPQLTAPYTVQGAASVEQQLGTSATLTLTYLHSQGVHQLFSINNNSLTLGAPPAYQFMSEGVFKQNQMITNFNIRKQTKLGQMMLASYYVLSYANGDSSGAGSFPSNPLTGITGDYGRTAFDVRNRLFLIGSLGLPKGFRVSPFMIYTSGAPFNITTGTDLNGDSIFNDRPSFASSSTLPQNLRATEWGNFDLAPGSGDPRIPSNFGTSPGQFTFNLRLSKTIGIGPKLESPTNNPQNGQGGDHHDGGRGGRGPGGGPMMAGRGRGPGGPFGERSNQRYSITFSAMARNLFNHVNPAAPIGNLSSQQFGQSIALAGGPFNTQSANRRVDFQVMFAF
jgi:hypothetical protein